jgi:hypothetical protein
MPQVDYAALAEQARRATSTPAPSGGTPVRDYAALAAQARQAPPVAAANKPGLLSAVWEGVKTPATMALEVVGRPAELISGTVGGALQTGSLTEGLKRGWAAFAEPNLRDSQIRESMSKVIEEQAPEFAKAHPLWTATAGFGLDVVTDPTNLLAGAGLWGRGVRALGRGATEIAAASKLGEVFPALRMEALVSEGRTAAGKFLGLTPGDMKRTAEAQGRAGQNLLPIVDEILKKTTPEQQQLLSLAAAYPKSAEAAQVAANPVLQDLLERSTQAFAEIHAKDVAGGVHHGTAGGPLRCGAHRGRAHPAPRARGAPDGGGRGPAGGEHQSAQGD